MTYEYRCTECEQVFDLSCPMDRPRQKQGVRPAEHERSGILAK